MLIYQVDSPREGERQPHKLLSPVVTGFSGNLQMPWGSRPRLYACACFRRLRQNRFRNFRGDVL